MTRLQTLNGRTHSVRNYRQLILSVSGLLIAIGLLMMLSATGPVAAYGHADATFTGKVTVDGEPAAAGIQVIVRTSSGALIGSGQTGANSLPADEYLFVVPESSAPPENSIVSITVEGFAHVLPVTAKYIYFGATVTADIATFTELPNELPEPVEGQAFIQLPQFVIISPKATAVDTIGNPIRVIGGTVRVKGVGEVVSVPVVLQSGTLESLDDPTTGITIRRVDDQMLIRIPFKDENGDDSIRVLIDVANLTGQGFTASGVINGLRIDAPTRSRDFSSFDQRVAVGSVKVLGNISSFPGDSLLDMKLVPEPVPGDAVRLADLLAGRDEESTEVAFVTEFVKTNLDQALENITLRLTVGKEWYDAQSDETVVVVRLADDGSTQVFPFVPLDPEADPVRFDLDSPNGLSAFIIVAVREAIDPTATPPATATTEPTPTSTSTPVPPTATAGITPTTSAPTPTSVPLPPTTVIAPTIAVPATATQIPTASEPAAPTAAPVSTGGDSDSSSGLCSAPADGRVSAGHIAMLLFPLVLFLVRRYKTR